MLPTHSEGDQDGNRALQSTPARRPLVHQQGCASASQNGWRNDFWCRLAQPRSRPSTTDSITGSSFRLNIYISSHTKVKLIPAKYDWRCIDLCDALEDGLLQIVIGCDADLTKECASHLGEDALDQNVYLTPFNIS